MADLLRASRDAAVPPSPDIDVATTNRLLSKGKRIINQLTKIMKTYNRSQKSVIQGIGRARQRGNQSRGLLPTMVPLKTTKLVRLELQVAKFATALDSTNTILGKQNDMWMNVIDNIKVGRLF